VGFVPFVDWALMRSPAGCLLRDMDGRSHMDYKDYYQTLGVPKTATEKDIKAAYRRLARKWHPDLNPKNRKTSEAKFKEINEANEVLSDPDKRKKYDELGSNWKQYEQYQRAGGQGGQGPFQWGGFGQQQQGGGQYRTMTQEELQEMLGGLGGSGGLGGFSDFFNMFFGGAAQAGQQSARRARRGQDFEQPVEITLEEACTGTQRVLEMQGEDGKPRRIEVKIPAGVDTGARVRMAGLGGQGTGGAGAGDVYLVVTVLPSPTFERKGNDLYADLPVDLTTLVLGGEASVPTPRGTRLALKIAPETQNGTTMRLAGQGMPTVGHPDQRGDLYVRIRAVLPTRLTADEKKLFEELRKGRG
jgi:DnaJ-class molecular chaperone